MLLFYETKRKIFMKQTKFHETNKKFFKKVKIIYFYLKIIYKRKNMCFLK